MLSGLLRAMFVSETDEKKDKMLLGILDISLIETKDLVCVEFCKSMSASMDFQNIFKTIVALKSRHSH